MFDFTVTAKNNRAARRSTNTGKRPLFGGNLNATHRIANQRPALQPGG